MSTPDSATNPLNTEQLMRTLLLDTQRLAEELQQPGAVAGGWAHLVPEGRAATKTA